MQNQINIQDKSELISIKEFSNLVGSPSTKTVYNTVLEMNNVFTIYNRDEEIYLSRSETTAYLSEHLSYNTIKNISGISSQTLRKLIKKHSIPSDFYGKTYDQIYIAKSVIQKYIFNEKYISGYELLAILGIDNKSKKKYPRRALLSVIQHVKKNKTLCELIGYENLDFPIYFKNLLYPQFDVFCKELLLSFLDTHISTQGVLNELKTQRSNLMQTLEIHNIPMHTLYEEHNYKFITKKNFEYLKENKELRTKGASIPYLINEKYKNIKREDNCYTKKQVEKSLQITYENFDAVLNEYKLQPIEVVKINNIEVYFYSKIEINKMLEEQENLRIYYSENYYTIKQIKMVKPFNYNLTYYAANSGEVEIIECPLILRGIFEMRSAVNLYRKTDVLNYFLKFEENKLMNEVSMDSPYSEFIYKTEVVLEVPFPDYLKGTKDLWYQYVKKQLNNTSTLKITSYINQFSRISVTLSSLLSKEIFNYSSGSLNRTFFSDDSKIPISYKRILYDFYSNLSKSVEEKLGVSNYQLELINNPSTFKIKRQVDMTRYTYNEYINIYNFSMDLSIHKQKAIKDVESFINGENYHHYDSYWLYILTHLTNNWRHSTIISELPEVDLSNTEINSLQWLKDNNPSINDANSIIFQIGRTIKEVNKTGAITEFRISEPLKIAFATAVSICQLRVNYSANAADLDTKNTGPLIWLNISNTIQPHHKVHKLFFDNFIPDFKFFNRKMNRTLITLIWSVFRSLKVAQLSRSHFSEDSTLHYIKLSDKQIDNLVIQLFERNSFGFMAQLLTQKLFNVENIDREAETQKMLAIYNNFGDTQKIEASTGLLNKIARQHDDILRFVNGLTKEEANKILANSMANTLYSKQKYYQCVFSECKFNSTDDDFQDCLNCPYSIINVYALSNLMDLYLGQIQTLINKFDSAKIGEKQKLANHFFLLWKQIQNAKIQFGEIVYDFVDGGKDRFHELSKQLPKTKNYLSNSINDN